MLSHIFVRNLAVVEHLSLDLSNGMTVITGETGAGKSILIDALSLAFGERADSRTIRADAEKAEISLTFDLTALPQVQSWLESHDLDADGECITRRILIREGRSKAYINGRPTPIGALKTLGDMMIDIHSQHAHQLLLKKEHQFTLLDEFSGLEDTVQSIAHLFKAHKTLENEIHNLEHRAQQESAKMALVHYQIEELEVLDLTATEWQQITEEQQRLANAEHLINTSQQAYTHLYERDDNIHQQLSHVHRNIEALCQCDDTLEDTQKMISDALITISEASSNLKNYTDTIEVDPEKLSWLEQRLANIHAVARKHHTPPENIYQHLDLLKQEKGKFDHIEKEISHLKKQRDDVVEEYHILAQTLSRKRQEAAKKLSKRVTKAIKPLGMPDGIFAIEVDAQSKPFSAKGWDQINFLVSANKGQPPQSLSKVASGGELSRISLAIQVEAARYAKIPTLVFDEVDVGIGGGVAEIIGKLIKTLGDSRQVICITHLPQVACQGHHHLKVSKKSDQHTTKTDIEILDKQHRIQEIARMLGGIELTEQTIAHAKEMLSGEGRKPSTVNL